MWQKDINHNRSPQENGKLNFLPTEYHPENNETTIFYERPIRNHTLTGLEIGFIETRNWFGSKRMDAVPAILRQQFSGIGGLFNVR